MITYVHDRFFQLLDLGRLNDGSAVKPLHGHCVYIYIPRPSKLNIYQVDCNGHYYTMKLLFVAQHIELCSIITTTQRVRQWM